MDSHQFFQCNVILSIETSEPQWKSYNENVEGVLEGLEGHYPTSHKQMEQHYPLVVELGKGLLCCVPW